jgi:flagellar biosynthesis protein FlhF
MREQPRSGERDPSESFQDFIRRQTPASAAPRAATAAKPAAATSRSTAGRPAGVAHVAKTGLPAVARSAEAGVAMYHEVARARADVEAAPAEAFEPASLPAAPAPEAARVVSSPSSSPAVFRQRATRDGEAPVAAAVTRPAASGVPTASPMRSATPPALPPAPEPAAALPPTPAARPVPASVSRPLPASAQPQEALAQPRGDRDDARVMDELRSLRAALSDRITALESNIALNRASASAATGQVVPPRNSAATRVMTRLLMSGFSPELARRVAAHAPATGDITQMDVWLHEVLAGNLRCATAADGLLESQGAIALVGPTGVGKTTTVAKLAARFAVRYGAAQLGLVTLDSYRIAAHEQLRSYGRILGIPMHIAPDGATLRELLSSLQAKRLVLIDTCGLSQRDERLEEMLGTLSAARFNTQPIRRVLLLNAASHSETLDEVARAWRAPDAAGAILTKLDEAARIGGAVDCLLRYRMVLFGLTNGQRVPEDWHPAGARLISHVALKPSTSPFTLGDQEAGALAGQMQGNVHA